MCVTAGASHLLTDRGQIYLGASQVTGQDIGRSSPKISGHDSDKYKNVPISSIIIWEKFLG